MTYLGRYKEFSSADEMKRVVSLLHRQAVRAKAEGLFFQVKSLSCFFVRLQLNLYFVCFVVGIRAKPVQNSPRGSEVIPEGPAVQRSRSAHQLHTPSILQSRRGRLVCAYRGNVYLPFFFSATATGADTRIFCFVAIGVLPEEPKQMEKVLQLGTGAKEQQQGQGGRRAEIPAGRPSQERILLERGTCHRYGRPPGGRPRRTDRMGEGGPSVLVFQSER